MKCKVEEELLHLSGILVGTGLMGRLKPYKTAKLTTASLSYTDGTEIKHIVLSSIRKCRMRKCAFHRLIKITCTDNVYHVTCDGDLDCFYQTLLYAIKQGETYNVIGCSKSIGGISRVMQMKEERIESTKHLQANAMSDLRKLKQMSQRMLNMAHRLKTEQRSISKGFETLKFDLITENADDVKHVMMRLMEHNDLILLQDLFCAVNRVRLCGFLTPDEIRREVESLQAKGSCKIVDLNGVCMIFSGSASGALESIVRMVADGPITTFQLAQIQGISIPLAECMMLYAQLKGVIVRDDGLYQVQYYHNPFTD